MTKLDVKDPNVFDLWRKYYRFMTSKEHLNFIESCAAEFPDQEHFEINNYKQIFTQYPGMRVLEIGGWKGELARYCLENFDIKSWDNIEVCQTAIDNTPRIEKYKAINPQDFFWYRQFADLTDYDLCISSNMIEHIVKEDLLCLMDRISNIKRVLLEAPLKKSHETWDNYWGTHILEWEWAEVVFRMNYRGYESKQVSEFCWFFEKG